MQKSMIFSWRRDCFFLLFLKSGTSPQDLTTEALQSDHLYSSYVTYVRKNAINCKLHSRGLTTRKFSPLPTPTYVHFTIYISCFVHSFGSVIVFLHLILVGVETNENNKKKTVEFIVCMS
jgi:hypothetical protein